jgi:hypothetical protein
MPDDPVEATGALLDALARRDIERVGLGSVNRRYFLFHVGMGFDAAVVAQVERQSTLKRYASHPLFVYAAFATWMRHYDRTRPRLAVHHADGTVVDDAYMVLCFNTNPYTYLGTRPLNIAPDAGLDRGLVAVAVRTLDAGRFLGLAGSALFSGARLRRSRWVDYRTDLDEVTVTGHGPFPYQVDGDHLGETSELHFRWEPDVLALVMPVGPGPGPVRARASAPTAVVVDHPTSHVGDVGDDAVDAQVDQLGHATGVVDRPHVHREAGAVGGRDQRLVDRRVGRVDGAVAPRRGPVHELGHVAAPEEQPAGRHRPVTLADPVDGRVIERRHEHVVDARPLVQQVDVEVGRQVTGGVEVGVGPTVLDLDVDAHRAARIERGGEVGYRTGDLGSPAVDQRTAVDEVRIVVDHQAAVGRTPDVELDPVGPQLPGALEGRQRVLRVGDRRPSVSHDGCHTKSLQDLLKLRSQAVTVL